VRGEDAGRRLRCPNPSCGAAVDVPAAAVGLGPSPTLGTDAAMRLMPGEQILYQSPGQTFWLTNYRVRKEYHSAGIGVIRSIMLEEVTSCSMERRSYPWLLVAGICAALVPALTLIFATPWPALVGFLLAPFFGLAYVVSREQVVTIASAGATIYLKTQGWTLQEVRALIDRIEAAKHARYLAG
jgi:hypothetical protein